MTEFGNYLSGIMVDLSMNATEFAQKVGIDSGNLSRILNGTQKQLRTSTLEMVCAQASDDEETQAHLLAAYLRDQLAGPAKERVSVSVSNSRRKIIPSRESSNLISLLRSSNPTDRFNKDLAKMVRAYQDNKHFRNAFHSLAQIAGELTGTTHERGAA